MNLTPSYKALIFNFILFILLGVFIWSTNIYGQIFFPSNRFSPFSIRSIISASLLVLSYYLNLKFCEKNELNSEILKFRSKSIHHYFGGSILGCILIVTMWTFLYLIYPFEIIGNHESTIVPFFDIVSYSLGNTLEEFLFRGFILLASVKLCGKIGGILLVSCLFGLFHLPGLGATKEGLSMVITTFTMSLLFIAVIYYTESIWTAVTLHITVNLLLHTLGFDGAENGLFQIKFDEANINGLFFILIYEIVVIAFAIVLFIKGRKRI